MLRYYSDVEGLRLSVNNKVVFFLNNIFIKTSAWTYNRSTNNNLKCQKDWETKQADSTTSSETKAPHQGTDGTKKYYIYNQSKATTLPLETKARLRHWNQRTKKTGLNQITK